MQETASRADIPHDGETARAPTRRVTLGGKEEEGFFSKQSKLSASVAYALSPARVNRCGQKVNTSLGLCAKSDLT